MLKSNLFVALVLTVILMLITIIDVKVVQLPSNDSIFIIQLLVAFLSFFFVNQKHLSELSTFNRYALSIIFSLSLAGLWYIASILIILPFHIFIGGSL